MSESWNELWSEEERAENDRALKNLKAFRVHLRWIQSELSFLKDSPDLASTIQFVILGHHHHFVNKWYDEWIKEREDRFDRLGISKRKKRAKNGKLDAAVS